MKKEPKMENETKRRIEYRKLSDIRPYENNPRNNEAAVDKVAASIREFGFDNPILLDRDGVVIAGHTRLEAAKKLGLASAPCIVLDHLSPEQARALRLADNKTSEAATRDEEKLDAELRAVMAELPEMDLGELGFEAPAAEADGVATDEGAKQSAELDALALDERMQAAKFVFFAFSGGRDSTRAIYLCARRFLETGKRCEAVYVGSACEFPDVEMHVRRVCADVGLPLKILRPERTFITEYVEKGRCPDSIFMDCVEELVNNPMDAYTRSVAGDEDYILVRGGQAKQKTSRSKTAKFQNPKSKPHLLIYNPLFEATPEQLAAPIPEWRGYAAGFNRTACWCCPFQKAEQFEALRANYPFLYEEMKDIVRRIRFPWHKGDTSNQRKFLYWERVEGITIQRDEG